MSLVASKRLRSETEATTAAVSEATTRTWNSPSETQRQWTFYLFYWKLSGLSPQLHANSTVYLSLFRLNVMVLREFSISIIQTSGSCKGAAVVSEGATGSRGRQRPPEGLQHSHCLPQLRRTRFYSAIGKRLERCCIAVPSENKGRLVQSASRRALFCVWILT